MKKIVLFSDAHGMVSIFDLLKEKYPDYIKLCMGDCVMSKHDYIANNDIYYVRGNSDYYCSIPLSKWVGHSDAKVLYRDVKDMIPDEMVVEIEGVKFLMGHGHLLPYDLYSYVKAWEVDCVCFGHTHRFKIAKEEDQVYAINPGSCNPLRVRELDEDWNRAAASICLVTVDQGKIVDIERVNLEFE